MDHRPLYLGLYFSDPSLLCYPQLVLRQFPSSGEESQEIWLLGPRHRPHRRHRQGFAFQLARKGLNLVLVGRSIDKLNDVSAAIAAKYGNTQTKKVVVDFSGDLNEGVDKIKKAIEGLDVGILINSVGVSYPYARYFHELDEELLKNLIKINVEGTTKVTQAVLQGMLQRKKRAIVNIGSRTAIVIPSDPLYAVYAATKASGTSISSRGVSMLNTIAKELMCSARFLSMWQQRWHRSRGLPYSFRPLRATTRCHARDRLRTTLHPLLAPHPPVGPCKLTTRITYRCVAPQV